MRCAVCRGLGVPAAGVLRGIGGQSKSSHFAGSTTSPQAFLSKHSEMLAFSSLSNPGSTSLFKGDFLHHLETLQTVQEFITSGLRASRALFPGDPGPLVEYQRLQAQESGNGP